MDRIKLIKKDMNIEISKLMVEALKAGDKVRLTVLRLMKSEIDNAKIKEKLKISDNLPEIKELNVLKKMAKEFKDEIENSKKAGNQDHADEVESQLKILEEFIPAPVSEEDIESSVKEIIKTIDHPLSMKDMGAIIGQVRSKFPTADGGIISKVVKSQING